MIFITFCQISFTVSIPKDIVLAWNPLSRCAFKVCLLSRLCFNLHLVHCFLSWRQTALCNQYLVQVEEHVPKLHFVELNPGHCRIPGPWQQMSLLGFQVSLCDKNMSPCPVLDHACRLAVKFWIRWVIL